MDRALRPASVAEFPAASEDAVRAQLSRVLAAPQFAKSKQLKALVEFLIDETLEGRAFQLKEYSIALGVFDREASFDPTADNIVRVEVRRLRAKLDEYYASPSLADSVRIWIPKGSYVPEFTVRPHTEIFSGVMVDHYRTGELLGDSPDGIYLRAVDANNNLDVLLWLSHPINDPVVRESRLAFTRRAAGVVRFAMLSIRDCGESCGRIFICYAPITGQLLSSRIEKEPLSPEQATFAMLSLAKALEDVHSAGLVSGSLRPENIVVESNGDSIRASLMITAADPWTASDDTGRSPEQREGLAPDVRSDVWALGAALRRAMRESHGSVSSDLPIEEIVKGCLADDPERRYQTAGQLAVALEGYNAAAQTQPEQKKPRNITPWALLGLLVLVTLLSYWFIRNWRVRASPEPVRLIVLPFEELGGDPQVAAFSSGLAEVIAERLSALPAIRVVATPTAREFKTTNLTIPQLGEKFGVSYVLQGTLLRTGDQVQINTKLIRAEDRTYAWTANYSGPWDHILEIDRKIAAQAAKAIGFTLRPATGSGPDLAETTNLEAFQAWSKGHDAALNYGNTLKQGDFELPRQLLSLALKLDPTYVNAMVDLGYIYWTHAFPTRPSQTEDLATAERFFRQALELDPEHPFALSSLGLELVFKNQRRAGLELMERALAINKEGGPAQFALANAYCSMGFWEAALVKFTSAAKTSPMRNEAFLTRKADLLSHLGRYSDAISISEEFPVNALERKFTLAAVLFHAQRDAEADQVLRGLTGPRSPEASGVLDPLQAAVEAEMGELSQASRVRAKATVGIRREDQYLLLDAVIGDVDQLIADLPQHPLHNNYRWMVTEPRVRRFMKDPRLQVTLRKLFHQWQQDLKEVGPRLPSQPAQLPTPDEYLRSGLAGQ